MAQLVSVVASTHNPRIFWNRDQADPDDLSELYATFETARQGVARARPDVIVAIGNDHLDSFFFDNLPTFAVATGTLAEGPFWYEEEVMNLPRYRARIHDGYAQDMLRQGVEAGLQVSRTHDLRIDHAFTLPLSFLRPEEDLPIVPIVTNAFGYPIPGPEYWYGLGQFVRRVIEGWPADQRVAVIGSFNLTVEVGGPKMGNYNQDFNRRVLAQIREGRRDELLALTVRELIAEGNSTAEFLNYIAILGLVEDRKPDFIKHKPVKGVGMCPVVMWESHSLT